MLQRVRETSQKTALSLAGLLGLAFLTCRGLSGSNGEKMYAKPSSLLDTQDLSAQTASASATDYPFLLQEACTTSLDDARGRCLEIRP